MELLEFNFQLLLLVGHAGGRRGRVNGINIGKKIRYCIFLGSLYYPPVSGNLGDPTTSLYCASRLLAGDHRGSDHLTLLCVSVTCGGGSGDHRGSDHLTLLCVSVTCGGGSGDPTTHFIVRLFFGLLAGEESGSDHSLYCPFSGD